MNELAKLDRAALLTLKNELIRRYENFTARNLSLDMTRGKPAPEQLDLAMGMLSPEICHQYVSAGGPGHRIWD